MENIEIVIKDINKKQIDSLLNDYITFCEQDIISSHFYDKQKDKDIIYQDINSFQDYFNDKGTCSIYLREITVGNIQLKDVVLIISCDEKYGDITINFPETWFDDIKEILFCKLREIRNVYDINKIIVGFEPAEDIDMLICELEVILRD